MVEPFLAGHAAGVTPNPCVGCNGHVRLDAMLAFADSLGAADLATGHYARATADGLLRAAADPAKDQTYMLSAVSPATLARLRFPLGELTKPEVRALAAEAELPVASKAESQDLCFLAGTGKAAFLARHAGLDDRPGEIVDPRRPRARTPPRRAPLHGRPAQGPRGRRGRAAVRAADRHRAPTASWRARARSSPPGGSRCAACGCTAPPRRSTRSGSATTRRRCARAPDDGRRGGAPRWRWSRRSTAPPPARPRACCAATSSWGGGRSSLARRDEVPRPHRGGVAHLAAPDHRLQLGDREALSSADRARCPRARPRPGSSPVASQMSTGWFVIP